MNNYRSDVVADVYQVLSRYAIVPHLPHHVLLDPSGKLLCTILCVRNPFVRVWFCNVLEDLAKHKANRPSLVDSIELRDSGDLYIYPVSYSDYQTLVPVPPLYPGKRYDNVITVTARVD